MKDMIMKVSSFQDLSYNEMVLCMQNIMNGNTSDLQIASFLLALKMKGESVEELRAMFDVMNEYAIKIKPLTNSRIIDTCGTGGDRVKTFNVSTASAVVAAAAGVNVAKHGNRSVSGYAGSADILEYFGYDLNLDPALVKECIEKIGIGFLFAPRFHPAMKHVANARKELGIRTAFNILGPIANPVDIDAQIVGVSEESVMEKVAILLKDIGRKEAMVFHAVDGLDELSNTCVNRILWLKDGRIDRLDVNPKSLDISRASIDDLRISSKDEAARIFLNVIHGSADERKRDVVVLNTAAALIIGSKADDFNDAIELARDTLASGEAYKKFVDLIRHCGDLSKFKEREEICLNC